MGIEAAFFRVVTILGTAAAGQAAAAQTRRPHVMHYYMFNMKQQSVPTVYASHVAAVKIAAISCTPLVAAGLLDLLSACKLCQSI